MKHIGVTQTVSSRVFVQLCPPKVPDPISKNHYDEKYLSMSYRTILGIIL